MDLDGAYAGAVQLLRDWLVAPAAAASNAIRGGGRDEEDGSRQTSGSEAAAPAAPKADGRRSSRGMVIYGSQKGNAKRLAHQLARGLRPFGVRLDVVDAADCEVERLRDARLVLVVISTYTEGSPPEPARWFCRSLGEAAHDFRFGADYLKGLTFAAFGCGNSQYGVESFNRCARDVCEHMRLMGANEAVPMHEGDEDLPASLDDQMAEWIPEVGPAVVGAAGPRRIVGSAPKKRAQAQAPAAAVATASSCGPDAGTDIEDIGLNGEAAPSNDGGEGSSLEKPEMLNATLRANLQKQGYKIVGSHSGVKLCRWTKSMLRGRGGCYKHSFYGIASHRCMEATPSLACANKCVFCWRHHTNPVGKAWKWKMDPPEQIVADAIALHQKMIKEMKGVPGVRKERLQEGFDVKVRSRAHRTTCKRATC